MGLAELKGMLCRALKGMRTAVQSWHLGCSRQAHNKVKVDLKKHDKKSVLDQ